LGTRRLASGGAGDDIREFEQKLKKGLHSARTITVCHRKIDSIIIVVENKNTVLVWLKAEASDKLNVLEKKFQEAERQEQMLSFCVHAIREKVGRRVVIPSNNIAVYSRQQDLACLVGGKYSRLKVY
jgi:hypothetical protein